MKQQHHPEEIRTFHRNANVDLDKELLMSEAEGQFIELINARTTDADGNKGGASKIKGEVVLYDAVDTSCNATYGGGALPANFVSMGEEEINNQIVEIWANRNSAIPPFIRVNGIIVASHPDLPFNLTYPIQTDKNESCVGGEIFTTDHNTPPIILNIKDMLLNAGVDVGEEEGTCTEKYFDDFDIDKYTINLRQQVDQMRFIRIAQNNPSEFDVVYGSTGLLGASYQYTYRYVTAEGDRLQMAPLTPTIQVPRVVNGLGGGYPYSRTFGTEIGDAETINGVHLRFRVTNLFDYDYIEIIRIPYTADEGLDFLPQAEIIGQYPLDPANPIHVVNILDYGAEGELVDEVEQSNIMGGIEKAKAIRYFGRKINLMNVTYASRDTVGSVTFKPVDGTTDNMVPVTAHLGKAGHADPWNSCYLKSRQHDENHGEALVLWDSYGNWTFAQDIIGFENHRMPQNRQAMSQASIDNSIGTPPMQMIDMTGAVNHCFEFWDTHDVRAKDNACDVHTIVGCEHDSGTVGAQHVWAYNQISNIPYPAPIFHEFRTGMNNLPGYYNCADRNTTNNNTIPVPFSPLQTWTGGPPPLLNNFAGPYQQAWEIGYHPLRPVDEYDNDGVINNDLDFVPNTRVMTQCFTQSGEGEKPDYKPEMFGLDYFSLGLAFGGLTSWPDWAVGFGLVRTKPAGRVVCEGMGFYDMTENDFDLFGSSAGLLKEQDSLLAYFPDLENGLVGGTTIADINANPDNYAVQLFAPVGFATEVYNFWDDGQDERDKNIDMIVYPRIQYEDGSINPGDSYGHVEFGKWRGNLRGGWATQNPNPGDVTDNGALYEFQLSGGSIDTVTHTSGRGQAVHDGVQAYRINMPNSEPGIYARKSISNLDPGGVCNKDFGKQDMKNWHEPLYMVRIVRKGVDINTTQNIKEFCDVGHWQKFESIIGIGDDTIGQSLVLVDERWEDCCPDISPTGFYANRDAFVYMRDENSLDEYPWLNVTYMAPATVTALNNAIIANGSVVHGGVEVFGLYTHSSTIDGRETYLEFNYEPIPQTLQVVVKYDNTIPIRVFSGDRFVGEDIFCPIDTETESNPKNTSGFALNAGFPYYRMQINPRMILAKRTYNTYGPLAEPNMVMNEWTCMQMDYVRQMVCLFPTLQKGHLGFPHERRVDTEEFPKEGFFPATHFIMRPNRWMPNGEPGIPMQTILNGQEDRNWCSGYGLSYPGHVYNDYKDQDYPHEGAETVGGGDGLWRLGGFRFEKLINYLYSHTGNYRKYQSRPLVGYEEQDEFCTRHIWSLERNINVQDEPGLRTFFALNYYDLDDRQGEIKRAWSATSEKGVNLYAFTDSGIALIITDKRIISDLNASELMLAGTGDEAWVQGEYWLSKVTGMPDEMYRASAERDNAIYFVDKESCWMFGNNQLRNIGKLGYHYRVRKNYIEQILDGYQSNIQAIFDTLHQEVWYGIRSECVEIVLDGKLFNDYYPVPAENGYDVSVEIVESIGNHVLELPSAGSLPTDKVCVFNSSEEEITVEYPVALVVQSWTIPSGEGLCFTRSEIIAFAGWVAGPFDGCSNEVLVYAPEQEGWIGRYELSFDRYLSFNNRTFGFRDGQTYELHSGYILNGEEIECSAEQVFNNSSHHGKEWLRVRSASVEQPTSIEFAEEFDGDPVAIMDDATFGQFFLKNYHGWEQYIPSKMDPPNDRIQGRKVFVRVKHKGETPFLLSSLGVQFKVLK